MDPVPFLIWGVVLPAVPVGVVLLLAWWRAPSESSRGVRQAVGGVAFAVSYAAGHVFTIGGWPGFPPTQSSHAPLWLAFGAALVGVVGALRLPGAAHRGARLILCGLVPWTILRNLAERWEPLVAFGTLGTMAVALLVIWAATDAWAKARPGASAPLALWLVATGGAVAVGLSGSAVFGQFGGTLAGLLGAALVVAWIRPRTTLAGGPVGVVTVVLAGMWIAGTYLSELPVASAVLLALAPLSALLGELGPLARLAGAKGVLTRAALVLVPVAVAVWIAFLHRPPPNPYAGY